MQSFCDLETDKVNATRFAETSAIGPDSLPSRESWLDRLARMVAPIPVDHVTIVPRHLSTAQELVRAHRRKPQCC
ncbi:MAG: hypothetical protein C0518_06180 [Opitutus sp.]|nr:hypothetical protein [Opitutus sp.]